MMNILSLGCEQVPRQCSVCQKAFETKNRQTKVCSDECYKARKNQTNKEKYDKLRNDPAKLAAYRERVNQRERRIRAENAKIVGIKPRECGAKVLKCKWCEGEYVPKKTSKQGRMEGTCSDLCRAKQRVKVLTMMPKDSRLIEYKESMDPPRKFNCRQYEHCLDFAAHKGWTGFSCEMCPVEDEWTVEELRQQAKAAERCMNYETRLKGIWK